MNQLVSACVLIYCEAGKFSDVLTKIRTIDGVKVAFSVLGRCDIIAWVEAEDMKALGSAVSKIAMTSGVIGTESLVKALIKVM